MYCNKCGNKLGDEKFCTKCGEPNMAARQPTTLTSAQKKSTSKKWHIALICVIILAVVAITITIFVLQSKSSQNKESTSHDYTASDIIDEMNEIIKEHESEQ